MMRRLIIAAAFAATPAFAEEAADAGGDLNPEELSIHYFMKKVERGEAGPMSAMHGYAAAKSGDYDTARRILEPQAEDGVTAAMTWMAWLEDNGLGAPEDPDRAANWDRRAAEAGDPIGKFNYGLDLMRGRGVAQDQAAGRRLIDEAAADGLKVAQRLQAADYDLDEVTPDADNWKYAPLM